ncbi:MAG: sialate O-acetylesterase [Chitinispirillaceae bacterium]|nr:sialate O-acetylesterase [Chitinispirillaceae bacterium]
MSIVVMSIIILNLITKATAEPDTNFYLFLCFGQSNMAGGASTDTITDCDTTSPKAKRVKVMAFMTCNTKSQRSCTNYQIVRTENQWYTAFPPYNNCSEGIGPADYFGKTLIDSVEDNIKIGFIPCSFSGQSIKVYQKNNTTQIPTWAHPTVGTKGYEWMINRCKLAQKDGVLKGILFHQGKSDAGQSWWVSTTKSIFDDIKKDLGIGDIPIVLGELLQDAGACCASHNPLVHELAKQMPNCTVVSSAGLKMRPGDQYNAHFDDKSMREFGRRYAREYIKLVKEKMPKGYIAFKGLQNIKHNKLELVSEKSISSWNGEIKIYSLNGRLLKSVELPKKVAELNTIGKGNVYLIKKADNSFTKIMIIP